MEGGEGRADREEVGGRGEKEESVGAVSNGNWGEVLGEGVWWGI